MIKLLDHVLQSYIASAEQGSFNGARADLALLACGLDLGSVAEIAALVESRGIDCVFSSVDLNPHIKRLPARSPQDQIERLNAESLGSVCLYPSVETLAREVSAETYRDSPFSRALLLGGAQLEYVGFELAVLGRYRSDPRFNLTFEDYVGTMSVTGTSYEDKDFPERDKISIQSFGLGFDEEGLPHVVAFHRYLANLTPEHQQYWNSFRTSGKVLICEPYYRASIIGDFWSNRSVRHAIEEEMRLINEMTMAAFGKTFFRHLVDAIVVPLQSVRRERQAPAHRFSANEFSKDFHAQRRKVLWSIYESLTTLREVMARQSGAENVHAPAWLREGLDVI